MGDSSANQNQQNQQNEASNEQPFNDSQSQPIRSQSQPQPELQQQVPQEPQSHQFSGQPQVQQPVSQQFQSFQEWQQSQAQQFQQSQEQLKQQLQARQQFQQPQSFQQPQPAQPAQPYAQPYAQVPPAYTAPQQPNAQQNYVPQQPVQQSYAPQQSYTSQQPVQQPAQQANAWQPYASPQAPTPQPSTPSPHAPQQPYLSQQPYQYAQPQYAYPNYGFINPQSRPKRKNTLMQTWGDSPILNLIPLNRNKTMLWIGVVLFVLDTAFYILPPLGEMIGAVPFPLNLLVILGLYGLQAVVLLFIVGQQGMKMIFAKFKPQGVRRSYYALNLGFTVSAAFIVQIISVLVIGNILMATGMEANENPAVTQFSEAAKSPLAMAVLLFDFTLSMFYETVTITILYELAVAAVTAIFVRRHSASQQSGVENASAQPRMKQRTAVLIALILASVVFGLLHYWTYNSFLQCLLLIAPVSFVLGAIFVLTKNFYVAWAYHTAYDLVLLSTVFAPEILVGAIMLCLFASIILFAVMPQTVKVLRYQPTVPTATVPTTTVPPTPQW